MGQNIVKNFAFLPPTATYGADLPNTWIDRPGSTDRIPGIFVKGSQERKAPICILYTHGNAEDIGQMGQWLQQISSLCRVDIFAYDYSGYGLSGGLPSELACYQDVELCFRHLVIDKHIDPRCIVLMGRSLGSGPTTFLASLLSKSAQPHLGCTEAGAFGGFILQSGLLSCVRTVYPNLAHIPFTDMFCNIDKIHNVVVPSLIIHGKVDTVVPFWHGQTLWNNLREEAKWRCLWLENANHNDIEHLYWDEVITSFIDYIDLTEKRFLTYRESHQPNQPPQRSGTN